ncbi:sensor histidine kinase RcsC [Rhodoferax lithotrophicus]|uniref:histidine kinase n=1 Tax=Rhodoferax lithotrophicus TaxID=2798804 RepID=A0ABN6D7K3_9BURK|nr:ATP-binding protein [Rhodoferax sp. MIZ03]BCO27598.1 sensor histidine kinase RcsC [Rhodoferax sp. MIZ03]
MSLRTKVLLPLAFFSVLLMGYLYGYWMPQALENSRAEYRHATERHLDSVVVGLTPLLLGHQLDTIYENLDALKDKNRDWIDIELDDAQGQSLYPLLKPKTQAGEPHAAEVHLLEKPMDYLGMNLGTLRVKVDFVPWLTHIEAQFHTLQVAMFVMIMAFVLSAWFVLERLVIRPVDALSKAASDLAQNRFEGPPLEKSGDDEVGHLVDRFTEMRAAIHDNQAALQRYKNQLEETVQQRTSELLLARDAAQAANKAKSAFLANMSHELRTPLNAILGFSSMMRRDPDVPALQHANLDIINRSGEHLLTLINDVLEVAKIEAGRMQLEIASFDLGSMVRDVVDMMQMRAQEKGLQLLIDQDSEFPRYIKGDEARLRQILVNLVSNAVKFTEQGGVTLRLGVKQNSRQHLLIEVEDSGPGISAEDQKRLFEPFVQLAEGSSQRGTGLGLTITRQFVELMGGEVSMDSTVGKGSLFRVNLPLELASMADIPKPQNLQHGEVIGLLPGQSAYRILIVEDQPENQLLLKRLMSRIGLETRVAENGAQGVDIFSQWHPHLIWMDRRMPVMDGIEATQHIRQLPEGRTVKIVAVTASAFKDQQQEMLDAGMDDFVRKPYRFEEIYDCLARQLGVTLVYQTDVTQRPLPAPVALTPAMLAALPAALCHELQDALENLDDERITTAIRQAQLIDPELSHALSSLVEYFNYPAILEALHDAASYPTNSL